MKLNNDALEKLPPADALCLIAYVKSLDSIKDYEKRITDIGKTDNLCLSIFSLVKETHESYSAILLNILAELPTIKDNMNIKDSATKSKAKKIPAKPKSKQ